jgi:hypothetical protein
MKHKQKNMLLSVLLLSKIRCPLALFEKRHCMAAAGAVGYPASEEFAATCF